MEKVLTMILKFFLQINFYYFFVLLHKAKIRCKFSASWCSGNKKYLCGFSTKLQSKCRSWLYYNSIYDSLGALNVRYSEFQVTMWSINLLLEHWGVSWKFAGQKDQLDVKLFLFWILWKSESQGKGNFFSLLYKTAHNGQFFLEENKEKWFVIKFMIMV